MKKLLAAAAVLLSLVGNAHAFAPSEHESYTKKDWDDITRGIARAMIYVKYCNPSATRAINPIAIKTVFKLNEDGLRRELAHHADLAINDHDAYCRYWKPRIEGAF